MDRDPELLLRECLGRLEDRKLADRVCDEWPDNLGREAALSAFDYLMSEWKEE
ncbi:MAG: hypothetical protein WC379_07125 [Methanoregula sp.]